MGKQILKFSLIGCGSGIVNFLVYNGTLWLLQRFGLFPNTDYIVCLAAGFLISVFWSFILNRKFVFTSESERAVPWFTALIKVYLSYSFTGIVLNSLLSILWVQIFHIPKEALTIINDLVCFPITFLLNKYWSYRKN